MILQRVLPIIVGLSLLSSCAMPEKNGEALAPQKSTVVLESHVNGKLANLTEAELIAINKFIDEKVRSRHSGDDILVMGVEKGGWPFFLEDIMRSNIFLNALPREKTRLVFKESARTPGVVNVFYTVRADDVPKDKQHPLNWIPSKEAWNKFIDKKANDMTDRDEAQMFLTLFYEGNIDQNPELILAVKGSDNAWNWDRMPHPKETITKEMLVPLLTLNNHAMARLLVQQ